MAMTKPLPSTDLKALKVDAGAQIRQAAPIVMIDEHSTISSK
jgi:hypothetical protein